MLRLTSIVTSRGNTLDVATIRPDGEVAGPPVLLLHPINMRKECWLGLLPVLAGAIGLGVAAGLPGRVLSVTGLGSAIEPHPDPSVEPPAPADDAAAEELFDGLARGAVAPGADESVVRTVRRLTNRHGAEVVTRILRAAYSADASAWLEDVRCPALWLTGEHDVTLSIEAGEDIARRLGGRHRTLSGVGHLPMIEDAAAVLAHLVPHLRTADALVPGR